MNIDHITPSILHIVAKENIDVTQDLLSNDGKSIAELLEKGTNEREEKDNKNQENKK